MIRPTINHPRINIFRPQTREAPGREASRTNPTPAAGAPFLIARSNSAQRNCHPAQIEVSYQPDLSAIQ